MTLVPWDNPGSKSISMFSRLTPASFALIGCLGCRGGCPTPANFDRTETYEGALAQWTADAAELNCNDEFPFFVAGECLGQGRRLQFLARGNGFVYEAHYFDGETGELVGIYGAGDVIDLLCFGQSYWPRRVQCSDGLVTEVVCGSIYQAGDEIVP